MDELVVGITGHRPNRLAIGATAVRGHLRSVLSAVRDGACSRPIIAVTALAEGADRLFATVALDLKLRLHVVLPFPATDYEATFGDPGATPQFRELLQRAEHIDALPGSLGDTKAAYEAQGRRIANMSEILVAVWDGKPSAGRGGTSEIIDYAVAAGKPVIWIDAAQEKATRLLRADRQVVPATRAEIVALGRARIQQ